jgi:hypothetical protein
MSTGGWLTMILSVGTVTAVFGWCLYRVLFCVPPEDLEHLRSEANITPSDAGCGWSRAAVGPPLSLNEKGRLFRRPLVS